MKADKQKWPKRSVLALEILGLLGLVSGAADAAVRVQGQVQAGGGAVAGSTVGLGRERQRAQTTGGSENGGRWELCAGRR